MMPNLKFVLMILMALTAGLLAAEPTTAPVAGKAAPTDVKDDQVKASAVKSAREMSDALIAGDYAKFSEYTYAKVVEHMGGKDKMVETMKAGQKEMAADGFGFKSMTVGDAGQTIKAGTTIFTVLPETLVMKTPRGPMTKPSYLIGISEDQGKTWTFIDGAPGGKALHEHLPELPEELKLDEPKKAEFKADENK